MTPNCSKASAFSPLPAGPNGQISPITPQSRAITASSPMQDEAKALIEHLAQPEFMNAYFNVAIYGPVLKSQEKAPGLRRLQLDPRRPARSRPERHGPAAPDVYNAAWADLSSNFIIPKMAQRVVVDGWDFDKAMDEAQTQGQAIYDKY